MTGDRCLSDLEGGLAGALHRRGCEKEARGLRTHLCGGLPLPPQPRDRASRVLDPRAGPPFPQLMGGPGPALRSRPRGHRETSCSNRASAYGGREGGDCRV